MKKSLLAILALVSTQAYAEVSCVPANPFTQVVYLNTLGARAWGWKCGTQVNYIVQLKTYYTNAACGRSIENVIRQYKDKSTQDNLLAVNKALTTCQKLPAAGTPEAALFDSTRTAIVAKTKQELP